LNAVRKIFVVIKITSERMRHTLHIIQRDQTRYVPY